MIKLYPLHRWTRWPDITEMVHKLAPEPVYELTGNSTFMLKCLERYSTFEFKKQPLHTRRLEMYVDRQLDKYDP